MQLRSEMPPMRWQRSPLLLPEMPKAWPWPQWHFEAPWTGSVTVSPSPQSKDEENEKLHKLRRYARDFRRQHTTDAERFDWDLDDGDYGLAIGRLVVT
jgi:hypothetical protein